MSAPSRRDILRLGAYGFGAGGFSACGLAVNGPELAGAARAATGPRLVTTELILTETALALGLMPLAAGNLPLYRRLVSTPALPAGISDLGPLNEPNIELLVHLAPDLILAADWQRGPQAALERIAPVLWLETLPFLQPPLEIGSSLATAIAGAGNVSAAPLIAALEAAVTGLRKQITARRTPPLILARFLEDGRHAMAFTEGSMPGDLLAKAGGVNALESYGPPGVLSLGLSDLLAPGTPVLSLGPLPQNPLFRRATAAGALNAIALPPVFPAGGIASACRLCEALRRGVESL